ncbi:MAG TPA: hypothetical protein PKH77_26315 [Anaerolineae bacterium]|nr:hypothetical protein [Anaerolineae bacterium]
MATLHLPFIAADLDGPSAQSSPRDEFVRLWLTHPLQQRRNCVEDTRLTAAALWMCRDMAARAEAGTLHIDTIHIDSLGRNANERVRTYYPLPLAYEDHLNYVESVAVDHRGAEAALQMLLDSPGHHDHIIGESDFHRAQTAWGLAFVAPAWWTLITAPPLDEGK